MAQGQGQAATAVALCKLKMEVLPTKLSRLTYLLETGSFTQNY